MNCDRQEGQWEAWSETAMLHWEKTMNDELAAVAGNYNDLTGKLQDGYAMNNRKPKKRLSNSEEEVD